MDTHQVPNMLLDMGMFIDHDGKIVWASERTVNCMKKIYGDKQKTDDTRARLKSKLEKRKQAVSN